MNLDIKKLFEMQLTKAQWEIIFSPEKLEDTIRTIVRKAIQEKGTAS
jgi:hypothetical protein